MARRGGGRGKSKDPWKGLPDDFRTRVQQASKEEIDTIIKDTALYGQALEEEKAKDQDLKSKQDAARTAGATYRDGAKAVKLKIAFARAELKSRCIEVPETTPGEAADQLAEEQSGTSGLVTTLTDALVEAVSEMGDVTVQDGVISVNVDKHDE